jgi:hypothetical protein
MGLEAVALDRGAPVVAHGERQEVVLDVGVLDAGAGAHEGGRLELVGGAEPRLGEEPARADQRLGDQVVVAVEGDRLGRGLLDVDLEVVLEVRADAGAVGDDGEAVLGEVGGGAYAREHQELRRVDRGGGEDDLGAGGDDLAPGAAGDLDAGGAAVHDHHALGEQRCTVTRPVARAGRR